MISVSEYAKSRGVSKEAINKQIRKKPEELDGHVFKTGNHFELDEAAVEYLDRRRQPQIMAPIDEETRSEFDTLREELLEAQKKIIVLQEEKINLIAEKQINEYQIEDSRRRLEEAEAKAERLDEQTREQEKTLAVQEKRIADLEEVNADQKAELESFERTIFGFFRKKR